MKKKLLSLALALAICLSLTSAAAPAAEPADYADKRIQISNVLDYQKNKENERMMAFRCAAPVRIAPGDGFDPAVNPGAAGAVKLPDEVNLTVEDYFCRDFSEYFEGKPDFVEDKEGGSVILKESGSYIVFIDESSSSDENGGGYCSFLVNVQTAANDGAADPSVGTSEFTDVKPDDWFYDAVQWAVENKIAAGTSDTNFSPNETCTNAQILTFLWRAAGSPAPRESRPYFPKVSDSAQYYYNACQWAYEEPVEVDESFDPNAPCTRANSVSYIWLAKGGRWPEELTCKFTDIQMTEDRNEPGFRDWNAVSWALEKGVTSGTGDATFSPDGVCTRAQIVAFLYRAFELMDDGQNENAKSSRFFPRGLPAYNAVYKCNIEVPEEEGDDFTQLICIHSDGRMGGQYCTFRYEGGLFGSGVTGMWASVKWNGSYWYCDLFHISCYKGYLVFQSLNDTLEGFDGKYILAEEGIPDWATERNLQ